MLDVDDRPRNKSIEAAASTGRVASIDPTAVTAVVAAAPLSMVRRLTTVMRSS